MTRAEVIWDAMDRAGMLVDATFGAETERVRFRSADQEILEGSSGPGAQSTEYEIEYLSGVFAGLSRGNSITVDGVPYTLRANPMLRSREFSVAVLTRT